jgi:CubicO group peptidase (beta-lactamase class C family)
MFRFKSLLIVSCLTWLSLACDGASAQAVDPAATETIAVSGPRETPAGHTFIAPEGFTLTRLPHAILVRPPEGDSTFAIVDIDAASAAKGADDAVASAWAMVMPDMQRKLKLATPRAARNGWADQRAYEYETSPNEKAFVAAQAWRSTTGQGSPWVVVLINATESTLEKRGAPLGQMIGSLRPSGYSRESLAGRTPHPLDAATIEVLKQFVATGMKALEVPGVGLSFIDGDRVVWEGGLGVKEMGKPDPVDAHTLFIAASNTKAMTTLLLAEDVDAGKLRWDEPVVDAYPAFKLGSPEVTKQVLVKHLVCACTGMPRQDVEMFFNYRNRPASSTFDFLSTMQPTSKFGEVFQYSNLMVAAAGYVAASQMYPGLEVGAAYDRAMHERVFVPLGMNDSTFDFAQALKSDHASPHSDTIDGHTTNAAMNLNYSFVSARPAGGLWTSPHDFSRFVLMELAKGKTVDGKRIVSEENLMERRKPQILVGEDVNYGMGLFVDKHYDIEIIHHGGDLIGYHSDMIWLPAYGIGATILTNSDSGVYLRGPLLRKMLEVLFDAKPEADDQLKVAAANRSTAAKKERERLVVPAAPADSAALASRYVNPELGALVVTRRGGHVVFGSAEWQSEVATRVNDDHTTSFVMIDPGLEGFEVVAGKAAGKRTLTLRDAQHEYVFTEMPVAVTNHS